MTTLAVRQANAINEIQKIAMENKLFVLTWDKADVEGITHPMTDKRWGKLLSRIEDEVTWSDINEQISEVNADLPINDESENEH